MKRVAVVLLAAFVLALVPVAAGAQTVEEKNAAVDELKLALAALDEGDSPDHFANAVADIKVAVEALKVVAPELDYEALDFAIASLEDAIEEGGDLPAFGGSILAAGNAVVAAAGDGDATAAPTGVAAGGPVSDGPNVALMGMAAVLALLAGAALVLRRSYDRS